MTVTFTCPSLRLNADKDDDRVWAGDLLRGSEEQGRGPTYSLARARVGSARERGARALEVCPLVPEPGMEIT